MNSWKKGAAFFALLFVAVHFSAQYEDSPLKGKRWITFSAGINSMDYLSWQGMATFSSRGENVLTQARIGYSQELVQENNDSCTAHLNRLSEAGILWGDGWAGRKWYFTAALGFGFNVRMFCRHKEYEDQYITAITLGLPVQIEFGVSLSKNMGVNVIGNANWNFRAPYGGGQLGVFYRLAKSKPVRPTQE